MALTSEIPTAPERASMPCAASDIIAILQHHAQQAPDRPFCHLYQDGAAQVLTFSDLARDAARFAALLHRKSGVREGEVVVIILPHGAPLLWSFLGVMWRRAVPTFMPFPSPKQDPGFYWRSHRELFAKIGARILVSSVCYREQIERHLDIDVLYVEDIAAALEAQTPAALPPVDSDGIAFLQHSSGTTGLKKGVKLSHRAVIAQIEAYAGELGLDASSIIASWLPLYHDMGLIACFMMPLICGASIVMIDAFAWVARPWLLLDCIERHQAQFAWLPNFAFRHLARTAPPGRSWDLRSLISLINCSEPCKPAEFEAFLERFAGSGIAPANLQVCYALAENVFAVSQTPLRTGARTISVDGAAMDVGGHIEPAIAGARDRRLLSCGRPLARTEVRIVGPGGALVAEHRIGEIVIRSASLFSGYNAMPELTELKLAGGWYHTGDLGFLDAGELFVTGRIDDLIIVYGRNYYAHEIEEAASLVDGVVPGRVVAFSIASATTGTAEVVVLAEPRDGAAPAELRRRIKSAILDRLGLVVQTVEFRPRGALVKSTSGKISRDRNRGKYLTGRAEAANA